MKDQSHHPLNDKLFWQGHVDQYQQSGVSKSKYCKQHKLIYHQFIYWSSKLELRQTKQQQPKLIPLKLSEKSAVPILATLKIPGGAKLSIHDESVLFRLIKAME